MHVQCPLGNLRLDLLRWTPISGAPFAQDPRSSRHRLSCVKDTFMPHHQAFVDVYESTRPFEEAGMEPENSLSMAASTESEQSWASGCAGGCLAPPVPPHNLPFLQAARPHPSRTTPAFELGSSSRCGCVPPGVGSVEGSAKLSRSPRPPATIAKGTSRKRKLTGVGLRPSSSSLPAACYLSSPSSSPRPRLPFGICMVLRVRRLQSGQANG